MLVLRMNEPETNTPDSGILEGKHSHLPYVLTHSMYFTYTSHRQLHLNFNLVNGIFLFC